MDGMTYHTNFVQNLNGFTSFTDHIELPPTSTIAQAYISEEFDQTDAQGVSSYFTGCAFIDPTGVQRTDNLGHVNAFSRNNLVRVDYEADALNGNVRFIINLFFWPSVV